MINESIFTSLRKASQLLANLSAKEKNNALEAVIRSLDKNRESILSANKKDVNKARESGTKESLVDRLMLNDERMIGINDSIRIIISQTDPVGEIISGWKTEAGLDIKQMRVPIGVASIIYESRPNVTVDAFALAWKSGNAILLRGSSSALESNKAIVSAIKEALTSIKKEYSDALFLTEGGREEVGQILNARGLVDIVLPRGGADLIKMVVENARIPVIETGSGICHLFVDESASIEMAVNIAENGKMQRPGACNSLESILVHESCAKDFLPALLERLGDRCEMRADERAFSILEKNATKSKLVHATKEDFATEFLDFIVAIKIVNSLEQAVEHINTHNTKHSDAIVTKALDNARYFQQNVDAACVYVNASTRFTDGGEFGFGAELGISTQKMHARGPMSLTALTTIKYIVDAEGLTR